MTLIVNQTNAKTMLNLIKSGQLTGSILRLFQNNYTPLDTDTAANFTQATFTGYAAITLNTWGTPFTNGSNKAEVDEIIRTFTQTGVGVTNTVYGYYVTDGSGNLLWAERNPAGGVAMNAIGNTYTVLPKMTLVTG